MGMFRGGELAKPSRQSISFTVIVAALVFWGSVQSPILGYVAGLIGLLSIIFASFLDSFWPTANKPENPFVFSLFWGVMLGGVAPMMLDIFLEGGFQAVYELLFT